MDVREKVSNGKRLIDADAMRDDWLENGENEYVYNTNAILDSIDSQQTVDAVEVVRCKDCKYYRAGEHFPDIKFCFRMMHPTVDKHIGYNFSDNDFCSYGERKESAD